MKKPPLVLVHGIYDTLKIFRRLERRAVAEGWNCIAPNLKAGGKVGLAGVTGQLAEHIRARLTEKEAFHLIGFSMGGIVARLLSAQPEFEERVLSLTTLGAPHGGSALARLLEGPGYRDLRPGSELLRQLRQPREGVPVLNIYTPLDLMVVPSRNCRWSPQWDAPVWTPLHQLLPFSGSVWRKISRHIEQSASADVRLHPAGS